MKYCAWLFVPVLLFIQCRPDVESQPASPVTGLPEVPAAIKEEHAYLLAEVKELSLLDDSTGRAAKRLLDVMQHHFSEEEEYVLPPLVLLPMLAGDSVPGNSKEIMAMTEKLRSQQVHLDVEHQMIKAILGEVVQAAAKENHPEATAFEKELLKHARMEEEILFPAAILVGEYLKMKLPPEL